MIRALIVDDEPLARERLRTLLDGQEDIRLVDECEDGPGAVTAIEEHEPDLVFLDIQMPEMNGFEVLDALGTQSLPVVIFVTAYDEYALRAFDAHAIDYLLKPFDRERFTRALARARAQIGHDRARNLTGRLQELLSEVRRGSGHMTRFAVKSDDRIFFLKADEIDWIEAEGNYARLHVGDGSHLIRSTLKALEQRLDPERFLRVHRSAIVNIDRIREMQPWFRGDYVMILAGGARVRTGPSYRSAVRALIDGSRPGS